MQAPLDGMNRPETFVTWLQKWMDEHHKDDMPTSAELQQETFDAIPNGLLTDATTAQYNDHGNRLRWAVKKLKPKRSFLKVEEATNDADDASDEARPRFVTKVIQPMLFSLEEFTVYARQKAGRTTQDWASIEREATEWNTLHPGQMGSVREFMQGLRKAAGFD